MGAPFNVLADTYNVWVPIEDTDLLKSVEVDANGDWIVQGVMTSDEKDEEDDSITPEGMDCSYFLTKGWIKYEHGNNPNQFIGEPLEVRVGQFTHPKLQKSVNGIYVKGRLFQNRELAKQAVTTIEDLQKSHTKRTMGWSIEGGVKERCRKTGKILKSVLRNVVLTMNPVNTMTWAELAKSFAKDHEVEVNMVDKSLDTAGMAEIMPQSLEGAPVTVDDEQEKWIKLFRAFCRDHALDKSLRKSIVDSTPAELGMTAYIYARRNGLDYDGACEYASYISDRNEVMKSLFGKFGGEKMSKATQNMADLLDTELEELRKSLELETEDEEEELVKSSGGSEDEDDDDNDDDNDDSNDDDDNDEDNDEEDEDDDKKPASTEFAKSLGKTQQQAFDVSGFLQDIAEEVGFHMDGFQKSMGHVAKQQSAVVNALSGMGELMKSMAARIEELSTDNADLQKSLSDVLQRPVGRKGVVNQREVNTITKSMGAGDNKPQLTRGRIIEVLNKSFEGGNMTIGTEIMRFEGGTPLDQLRLTAEIKQELGI